MEKKTLAQLLDDMRLSAEAQYGEDSLNQEVVNAFVVVQLPRTEVDGKPADCLLAMMGGDNVPRGVARALATMAVHGKREDSLAMPLLFISDLQKEVYEALTSILLGVSTTEVRGRDDR